MAKSPAMVFCAYCGKSFTRKEHLERHIPSHTNVKPHRCSACQLSFARRDLLQRHHSTYHEARDPMEPLPGGVPTVAGRTPIACQNCANAKTGCDKRVPCSRCAEKNLPCAARFARRSSKAAVRTAQANAAAVAAATATATANTTATAAAIGTTPTTVATDFTSQLISSPAHPGQSAVPSAFMDLDPYAKTDAPLRSPLGLEHMVVGDPAGLSTCLSDPTGLQHHPHLHHPQLQQHPQALAFPQQQQKRSPPAHGSVHFSPDDFSAASQGRVVDGGGGGLDDFMGFETAGVDFLAPETSYQDLIWSDYPIDMDLYESPLQIGRPADTNDTAVPGLVQPHSHFTATTTEVSDISSSSEPMTVTSSRGSVHTRDTSIISSGGDRDRDMVKHSGTSIHEAGMRMFKQHQHQHQHQPVSSYFDTAAMAPCVEGGIPEFEVVVASEAAWPLARCTPPIYSGTCPRTAIVHLECLEHKSKQDGTWLALEQFLEHEETDAENAPQVVPLTSRSRDKMLAITQSFLHKALDIHRSGLYPKTTGACGPVSPGSEFNFIVLPPSRILEYFLKSYVHSLAIYYPLIVGGVVDPNEMLDNNQASTLLVLLMIAQGAAMVPTAEARYLSSGLAETCRISLFDIIEKNVELSADPTALRCALLFTLLGAWGGDKWQMDISMGQRNMYISMLKHAGMLESQPSMVPDLGSPMNGELQWRSWLHRELQNRLVYNWVMVDQELSLFHDTAPVLSISDLQCPLPSAEALWLAPTAGQWAALLAQSTTPTSFSPTTPSLCELFRDFLHDNNLARRKHALSPQQLRLLLYPLQSLLCHLRQMLLCVPDATTTVRRASNRTVTKASTTQRLEEVQAQLQQWYELTMVYANANPGCPITRCNLVLYHLISLNAVTDFAEVERLARRDGFPVPGPPSSASAWGSGLGNGLAKRHARCINSREEAVFHCGQVLRFLRQMPADRRPSWWSAGLYRVILILWADSVCTQQDGEMMKNSGSDSIVVASGAAPDTARASSGSPAGTAAEPLPSMGAGSHGRSSSGSSSSGSSSSSNSSSSSSSTVLMDTHSTSPDSCSGASLVVIDQMAPDDLAMVAYLWRGDGTAVLTRSDGSHFALDEPAEILHYAVKCIDEAVSSRISDGIRRKLMLLASNWGLESTA